MKIIGKTENKDIATVYIAEFGDGRTVEFVESVQPPIPREKKWVLIVSTLLGCPVGCKFCDSGRFYNGLLSSDEILAQIDFLVTNRFPSRKIPADMFKIQFARMGEPAFNPAVLDVLRDLPALYDAPGMMPALSTIAPSGTDAFFDSLLEIKESIYRSRFQLQFSLHSTNGEQRDWLVPVKKWDFGRIAEYGDRFFRTGDRKITLNFALAEGIEIDPAVLLRHFATDKYFIKLTPVNPTYRAKEFNIESHFAPGKTDFGIVDLLSAAGYDTLLSVGELEENNIGSNCGQYLATHLMQTDRLDNAYTYRLEK